MSAPGGCLVPGKVPSPGGEGVPGPGGVSGPGGGGLVSQYECILVSYFFLVTF